MDVLFHELWHYYQSQQYDNREDPSQSMFAAGLDARLPSPAAAPPGVRRGLADMLRDIDESD